MAFETLQSEMVYAGRAFKVRRDQVRLPDGQTARLDVVEHVGSVSVVPVDAEGQVWFVEQYRHPARQALLELPAGTLEAGEDPLECARRELREEIGMGCEKIEELGGFFLAPGYSTEYMHVYLATGLYPDPLPGDADEFLSVAQMAVGRAFELAQNGQIPDAKTLAALLLAQAALRPV
jgi:ADP-ribose pyrophosphatase